MKPFMGTTEECLQHFVEAHEINNTDGKECKTRNGIANLFGITQPTAYNWFAKGSLPGGEKLLRLRYFLELLGYQPIEREGMPELIREFSNQISLRAISVQDAAQYIGTSTDIIVDVLMCRYGTSSQREEQIRELVQLHREEATQKLQEWQATLKMLGLDQPPAEATPQPALVIPKKPTVACLNDDQVIKTLAYLILAAKPLAEYVLSDHFSAEERDALREKTVTNGRSNAVFELSNLLNRLCSERARKQL